MTEKDEIELLSILNEEERILDSMLDEQTKIYNCVVERSWTRLHEYVENVNQLGSQFVLFDSQRETLVNLNDDLRLKPNISSALLRVKSKLTKSKVENEVLSKYVNATKEFISGVIENYAAKNRNKVYNQYGGIKKNYASSIAVNTII